MEKYTQKNEKISVYVTEEDRKYIRKLRESCGIRQSWLLHEILSLFEPDPFSFLSPSYPEAGSAKARLTSYCEQEISQLSAQIQECGNENLFLLQALTAQLMYFRKMVSFLSGGEKDARTGNGIKNDNAMAEYVLKDGRVLCPQDWKVLGNRIPGECNYAGCVEISNARVYGFREKHFLFFTDTDPDSSFSEDEAEAIITACSKIFPQAKEIWGARYISGEDAPDVASDKPHMGLYHISEDKDCCFPYGCRIIRENDKEKEFSEIS